MKRPIRYWRYRFGLVAGSDINGTEKRVRNGASLSPENLWLLACSALLTSIGLDQDSAAVIIGAMLISPLMGPILAVGLAIGTADRELLLRSVKELALATIAGILLSAVYFWLTPFGQPTRQLLARTQPTLLDVGVALFGGIAGIVAGSRRRPSLALPGVAIATALMPPLCTAGFGLATGRPAFFFGALYLFVLNAIFIALATFVVVRWLKFPELVFVNVEARRKAHRLVMVVVVVAAAPSLYFLYRSALETRENQRVESFIRDLIHGPDREAIRWEIAPTDSGRELKIYVAGAPIEPARADSLGRLLPARGLGGLGLRLVQSELSASDVERLRTDAVQGVMQALAKAQPREDPERAMVARDARVRQVSRELAAAMPEIVGVTFATVPDALSPADSASKPALLLAFRRGSRTSDHQRILERARAFLRERVPVDSLDVRAR